MSGTDLARSPVPVSGVVRAGGVQLSLVVLPVAEPRRLDVDTLIENPEIAALRGLMYDHVQAFARQHDLTVRCDVLSTSLTEQWWVRIIGSRKLPSYPGGEARCSVDMKVNPITRHGRRLQKRYTRRRRTPGAQRRLGAA